MVLDGQTGLLVPPSNAPALADALVRLAADAPLRDKMGALGRQRVCEHFSLSRMTDQVEALYRRELRRRVGHGSRQAFALSHKSV